MSVLLGLVVAWPAWAKEKEKADPAGEFFTTGALHTVYVRVSYEQFQLMQPRRRARPAPLDAGAIPKPADARGAEGAGDGLEEVEAEPRAKVTKRPADEGQAPGVANYGYEYPYVKARVEIDDVALADVGVRYKGNSSYDGTSRGLKRPLKVDFNRFVPGRKFLGLEAVNLGNNAFDPSLSRESLSYHVYRAAGVAAPRTALATVYLTVDGQCEREYVGLYTIVEEVDGGSFLKRAYGRSELPVFKPESIRGLPYMGEEIENYAERYRPKNKVTTAEARPLIEFVKLLNYADDATFRAKVEQTFDVDAFLRYLACTALLCDLDSILANYHNFYLVVVPGPGGTPGKVHFLPWDMNLSLASYGGGAEQLVNLDVRHPWGGSNLLIERILAVDAYRAAYLGHVRRIVTDVFNEERMTPVYDRLEPALLEAEEASAASIPHTRMGPIGLADEKARGWHGSGRQTPRAFIAARAESVVAQLDGTLDPAKLFVPQGHNPGAMRMGVRAAPSMGNLAMMGQAIRAGADRDGDFAVSPAEARAAVAALYAKLADPAHPEGVDAKTLAERLEPWVTQFGAREVDEMPKAVATPAAGAARPDPTRGWGRGRRPGSVSVSGGQQWARAIVAYADRDGDGRLSLKEWVGAADQLAFLRDVERTGKLREREIIEALDAVAAPEK